MIFHKNAYEMKFFQILYPLITEMTIQLFSNIFLKLFSYGNIQLY